MSAFTRSVLILIIFNLFLLSPLQAKIRKCVLSNGHVIFTDIACPSHSVTEKKDKVKKKVDPFEGMSDAQRKDTLAKRDKVWEKASKSSCLTDIDNFAARLQPNFSEIIVKNQLKLVSRNLDKKTNEFVHRVSFFFMADGKEWESSGNCHATLRNNSWSTEFKRVTTGKPFISARKDTKKETPETEIAEKPNQKSKPTASAVTAANGPK